MTDVNRPAFTLIETMLFLAISALVFLIGFIGISSRLAQVRYTDSVRNLESDMETAFRGANDGLNLRSITGAANDCEIGAGGTVSFSADPTLTRGQDPQCLVAGVEIEFKDDALPEGTNQQFITHQLALANGVGSGASFRMLTLDEVNDPDDPIDIEPLITSATRIDDTERAIDTNWGLTYTGYFRGDNPATPITNDDVTVRYIRSPISPQTYTYWLNPATSSFEPLTENLHFCFKTFDDRTATILFRPNSTANAQYDQGRCTP